MIMAEKPTLFLVACEPSGDLLGARLIHAMREKFGDAIEFKGIGGERMQAEGLQTLFHQKELALFGLFELLPKIPHILKRLAETAAAVKKLRPKAVITIDGPDFSFRLAKKLKGSGIPLIHYVAPTVWAWREGRAKKIAALYDHLLALLPFEPPYFEKEKLATSFIGHAVMEQGADKGNAERFRAQLRIPEDKKILCVLPGSRRSEIKRLAPVFGEALCYLLPRLGNPVVVVPVVDQVHEFLLPYIEQWPVKPVIVMGDQHKYDAFAASHVAMAASGTVSLELMAAGTPHLIAYKLNPFTVMLYRRLIKVKYANLVNLLHDRPIVPEILQKDCTAEKLAQTIETLWLDETARTAQKEMFLQTRAMLLAGNQAPSAAAAVIVSRIAGLAP
jgi:lipid-A-disaccharide synthase